MTTNGTDRYGVMGYPVSHSRSPIIHRLFAQQTGHNIQYELLQVTPEKLAEAVQQFRRTGGRGLNITLPHKRAAVAFADSLSDRAQAAGAVNTLVFNDEAIFGDNTDGVGLVRDLKNNLGLRLTGSKILVLGAGGATRGIIGPLLNEDPKTLLVANRTLPRAEQLLAEHRGHRALAACRFEDVPEEQTFSLVINATSAGVKGETPPYPETAVGAHTTCYDLSYALRPTPFVSWAAKVGAAHSAMGWGMLVEQAAESFHLWRGVRPDTASVLKQLAVSAA